MPSLYDLMTAQQLSGMNGAQNVANGLNNGFMGANALSSANMANEQPSNVAAINQSGATNRMAMLTPLLAMLFGGGGGQGGGMYRPLTGLQSNFGQSVNIGGGGGGLPPAAMYGGGGGGNMYSGGVAGAIAKNYGGQQPMSTNMAAMQPGQPWFTGGGFQPQGKNSGVV